MNIGHKCSMSISNLGFGIIMEQKPHKNPWLPLRFLFGFYSAIIPQLLLLMYTDNNAALSKTYKVCDLAGHMCGVFLGCWSGHAQRTT